MLAISMALLQHCSTPLARAVRPPPRARARACSTLAMAMAPSSSSPRNNSQSQQQILLGMSENELQQLALDMGQVKILSFSDLIGPHIIQLGRKKKLNFSNFRGNFFVSKALGGSSFTILCTRGRSEKFRSSFSVSISTNCLFAVSFFYSLSCFEKITLGYNHFIFLKSLIISCFESELS